MWGMPACCANTFRGLGYTMTSPDCNQQPHATLKQKMKSKVGIAWYDEKDYTKLVTLSLGGTKFPKSFDDWLDGAEKSERALIERGYEVVRITVEPTTFSSWCVLKGIRPDATARRRYIRHGALIGRPPKD